MRLKTQITAFLLACVAALLPGAAGAQDKVKVVATFSILGDFAKQIGGDRAEVATLVGPDGDAHSYSPSPADSRRLAEAKLVVANGLKLEGWMGRLIKSSGTKARVVEAAKGVKPLKAEEEPGHEHGHDHAEFDPHAWQSIANAKIYAANIRDGLAAADPAGKAAYEANAATYLAKLDALEAEVKPSAISRRRTGLSSSRHKASRPRPKPRPRTSPASSSRSGARRSKPSSWRTSPTPDSWSASPRRAARRSAARS